MIQYAQLFPIIVRISVIGGKMTLKALKAGRWCPVTLLSSGIRTV